MRSMARGVIGQGLTSTVIRGTLTRCLLGLPGAPDSRHEAPFPLVVNPFCECIRAGVSRTLECELQRRSWPVQVRGYGIRVEHHVGFGSGVVVGHQPHQELEGAPSVSVAPKIECDVPGALGPL